MCQARFSVALTSEHDLPIQCSPASNKKVNSLALFLLGYFTVTLLLGHFLTRGPIRHTLFLVFFFFFLLVRPFGGDPRTWRIRSAYGSACFCLPSLPVAHFLSRGRRVTAGGTVCITRYVCMRHLSWGAAYLTQNRLLRKCEGLFRGPTPWLTAVGVPRTINAAKCFLDDIGV